MKILYLVHTVELPIQEHVIEFLRLKGFIVDVVKLGPAPVSAPETDVWAHLRQGSYPNKVRRKRYDYVISNTHSSYISNFFKMAAPSKGVIDIEHDLFSAYPERAPKSTIFTFQEKHSRYCEVSDLPFVKARWTKLDAPIEPYRLDVDPWEEVVVIGTSDFFDMIKKKRPFDKMGFKKLWYKKYLDNWACPLGTDPLPKEFVGPMGIKLCAANFKFIIVKHSSCFLEFLLMGGLPLLLPNLIKTEVSVNEVLSKVSLKGTLFEPIGEFEAITTKNLKNKIKLLKGNPDMFEETRQRMLGYWVKENYLSLPPLYLALYEFIMKEERHVI